MEETSSRKALICINSSIEAEFVQCKNKLSIHFMQNDGLFRKEPEPTGPQKIEEKCLKFHNTA